ncbi:MAG: hypothetical protein U0325_34035 [Polyangiales bacterium]
MLCAQRAAHRAQRADRGEFSQAVWFFAPYSDADRDVSLALDALLRR